MEGLPRFLTFVVVCDKMPSRHEQDMATIRLFSDHGLPMPRGADYESFLDVLDVHFFSFSQSVDLEVAVFFKVGRDGE